MKSLSFGALAFAVFAVVQLPASLHTGSRLEVRQNQFWIDGEQQPQLFGAELQYFRLRGGYGKNIPRAKVLEQWQRAIDRMVEAKMNTVSFYIPWDFHEYAEGKFDFTGTADEDGDGKPDYPSRDLITFFKMLDTAGLKRIMVRPGPYINAEWGFLGFGAIPMWFHDKYPNSHMLRPDGRRKALYDYHDEDLHRHTKLWFEALLHQVLDERMGPGQPIVWVQIDNETNYQWQSIYQGDYSPKAVARYQAFLKESYGSLERVNRQHARTWSAWEQIQPPLEPGKNIGEDQDWYRFSDHTMFTFLRKIRRMWEELGVREPDVMFTLAESYNSPQNGMLPNYVLRGRKNETGLLTVNLYPKTWHSGDGEMHNSPFKADLDVMSADTANVGYFGKHQEWTMGPEIQGGWWKGIPVSPAARQQTYLTVLGHGMKAMFVYYFHEGYNWDVEWPRERALPLFNQLKKEWKLTNTPIQQLSNEFWGELQNRFEKKELVGFDVRHFLQHANYAEKEVLFFDSPLDQHAQPRGHYKDLARIGKLVIAPYRDFLGRATAVYDRVAFVKDSSSHAPSALPGVVSYAAMSIWSEALLGYLMNADVTPKILHGDLSDPAEFGLVETLFHMDTGTQHPRTLQFLQSALGNGKNVVNFLGSRTATGVAAIPAPTVIPENKASERPLRYYLDNEGRLTGARKNGTAREFRSHGTLFAYDLTGAKNCEGILFSGDAVVGYRCRLSGGNSFVQIGPRFFEWHAGNAYGIYGDHMSEKAFLKSLLKGLGVKPVLRWSPQAERTVAFARKDPSKKLLWVTVKTAARKDQNLTLAVKPELLAAHLVALETPKTPVKEPLYRVKDLLGGKSITVGEKTLTVDGFPVTMKKEGSTVYVIERLK